MLLQEAQAVSATPGIGERYDEWPVEFLTDYITNRFHSYTRDMLAQIGRYAETVANAHGSGHPETVTIAALWQQLQEEMTAHLQDEEELLFPYIKQLAQRRARGDALALIAEMGAEHEAVGDALGELARLSGGYIVPADGCNTFRALYGFLNEFEATTKKHIHLENNILFPKTIELERRQN